MISDLVVRNYIARVRNDPSVDTFDRFIEVFDYYQFPGYLDVMEEIMLSYPDATDEDRVRFIFQRLKGMVIDLLAQQGIVVNEEVITSTLLEFADGVRAIQDYTPEEDLLRIAESDLPAIEALAECVALTSIVKAHESLMFLVSVNESTIALIKDALSNKHNEHDDPIPEEQLAQWKKWKELQSLDDSDYVVQFTRQSGSMGLPMQLYMNLWMSHRSGELSELHTTGAFEAIAKDLLSLAFISEDCWKQPLVTLKQTIRTLHLDGTDVAKLDMSLTNLYMALMQNNG